MRIQDILRRLLRFLFKKSSNTHSEFATSIENPNIIIGNDVYIDPSSAVNVIGGQGKIKLFGKNNIGKNVEISPASELTIGYGTSIQDRSIILGDVTIGKFCLTAPNVYISSGNHYFNYKPELYIKDQDKEVLATPELSIKHSQPVIIEDDVWIGINSVLSKGITIGRGSVIGANSVVKSNVEPFSVVGGIPAKLIKKRLDFVAKNDLKFDQDCDLPNFYMGFFLDQENLMKDREMGGIAATSKFKVYMKGEGSQIELTLKKIVQETLYLKHGDSIEQLEQNEFVTINFKKDENLYHEFDFGSGNFNDIKKYVLIKEIKIR